jgi:hypothetical protein
VSLPAILWVLEHSAAANADRLVLICLASHAHPDGTNAYPSVAKIAHETALSARQVQRSLRSLEEADRVRPLGKSEHGTTNYAVVLADDRLSPRRDVALGGDISSLTGDRLSPEQSVERGGRGSRTRETSIEPNEVTSSRLGEVLEILGGAKPGTLLVEPMAIDAVLRAYPEGKGHEHAPAAHVVVAMTWDPSGPPRTQSANAVLKGILRHQAVGEREPHAGQPHRDRSAAAGRDETPSRPPDYYRQQAGW